MAPTADATAASLVWLWGVHVGVSLEAPTREELTRAFEAEVWTLDDIPVSTELVSTDDIEIFRLAFSEQRETALEAGEESVNITPLMFRRFVKWLKKGYIPGMEDVAGGSVEGVLAVMSELELQDSTAQGASGVRGHVAFVELCLYLGRAPTAAELKGFEHGMAVSATPAAALARKGKIGTIEDVIGQAVKQERINLLTDFVHLLEERLLGCGHPSAPAALSTIRKWWNTTLSVFGSDPPSILDYLVRYRVRYLGRGLPTDMDLRLQAQVMQQSVLTLRGGPTAPAPAVGGAAQRRVEAEALAASRAADQARAEETQDMVSAMSKQLAGLAQQQREATGELKSLKKDYGGGGGGGGGGRGAGGGGGGGGGKGALLDIKCYACGQMGHIGRDCPRK
jgi:uncharacterized membrane protein YgcG